MPLSHICNHLEFQSETFVRVYSSTCQIGQKFISNFRGYRVLYWPTFFLPRDVTFPTNLKFWTYYRYERERQTDGRTDG